MRVAAAAMSSAFLLIACACGGDGSTRLTVEVANGFEQRSYSLYCDPPAGTYPKPRAACDALARDSVMLVDPNPKSTCIGGVGTAHIHVTGTFRGEDIDAEPDSCNGNGEGERFWMRDLPPLKFGP